MRHVNGSGRLTVVVAVLAAAGVAAGANPAWYARKATWQETAYASRAALARRQADQAARQPAPGDVTLGPWYRTRPQKGAKSLATAFFPEKGLDPTTEAPGAPSQWSRQDAWRDGSITHLGGGRNTAVYVFREITAAKAGAAAAWIGCDDHMMVWLNGKLIHKCTKRHGVRPNEHKISLPLRAGPNKLLMKVRDVGGVHAFYFSTKPQPAPPVSADEARLWALLERDFADPPAGRQMRWERADGIWQLAWAADAPRRLARQYARRTQGGLRAEADKLARAARSPGDLAAVRKLYYRGKRLAEVLEGIKSVNLPALRRAVEDLTASFPERYGRKGYLKRLDEMERLLPELQADISAGKEGAVERAGRLVDFRREALLANPLLDFDRLLMVRRGARSPRMGLPANWQGNSSLARKGYDDEIVALSPVGPEGKITTVFRPPAGRFVGDLDLHFDADRLLLSMPADNGRWQVFEVRVDGGGLRQVTPGDQPDVDNYDGCYLPDGRIIFSSTACMAGVPCVGGASHVANLYLLSEDGGRKNVRQLCFDQDHNWCPTVLPNGRVLFTRWEYSDIPHAFSRILFHMNPDGTGQMEYYGSNSYWPNSIFYARPIPGAPTRFVGIVTGHHGVARVGEMIIFDTAKGRHEADGVVQRIGDYGKAVEPILLDGLVNGSWPKFLHPWPLGDASPSSSAAAGPSTALGAGKYFLASAQVRRGAPWCVVLVDVWDNLLPLCEVPGSALLEPIPLRRTPRPPAIPDRVDLTRTDALVYLTDVYAGAGLKGVRRGTVRRLRLSGYHFAYHGMGGQPNRVGLDGPWDVRRILGTVPVEPDGSACFRVPANTPISLQPLDEKGQAVQRMRSWFTAMPGEQVSCVGCHERQDEVPQSAPQPLAFGRKPSEIEPWYGPARGFGFKREVQPVLDRYCVGCHNGKSAGGKAGGLFPDFRARPAIVVHPIKGQHGMGRFSPSYYALRRFVRSPTIESDLHLLPAWEFHADSTKLVQMLRKGHHGVRLGTEAWDRIITWIDLHAPAHGTWHEIVGLARVERHRDRRRALRKLYAGIDEDPEAFPAGGGTPIEPIVPPAAEPAPAGTPSCPGWPFDADEARRRQADGGKWQTTVDLGDGLAIAMVRIPAGEFVMGSSAGHPDERPMTRVRIERDFWMATCEVTNEQFARFDAAHDSRLEHGHFLQFSVRERGYPLNEPNQPVVRVSWLAATAFCRWLSARAHRRFALPSEAQWEYACRAGADTPLSYGPVGTDHAKLANLADRSVKTMEHLGWNLPYAAIPPWHPTDGQFDDGSRVSAAVGSYRANAWGLHDMHGNVCEWTRTDYRPYPYRAGDGREGGSPTARKVVRGGSWYDRPRRARSAFRLSYRPSQSVYDVGFRVVCEAAGDQAGR